MGLQTPLWICIQALVDGCYAAKSIVLYFSGLRGVLGMAAVISFPVRVYGFY